MREIIKNIRFFYWEFFLIRVISNLLNNEKYIKASCKMGTCKKKLAAELDYSLYCHKCADITKSDKYQYQRFKKNQILNSFYSVYTKINYPDYRKTILSFNYRKIIDFLSSGNFDKIKRRHQVNQKPAGICWDDDTISSQRHNNLRLSIIKFDMLYRGAGHLQKMIKLKNQCEDDQQNKVKTIFTKPLYREKLLSRFKKTVYFCGIM